MSWIILSSLAEGCLVAKVPLSDSVVPDMVGGDAEGV